MGDLCFGALCGQPHAAQAREIEVLGYDSIWVSEHILFYGPMLEALTQLAAVAAVTERASLGTAVYLMPLRHPTITAKTASTVDVISGGRLILGVGVGGEFPKEFTASGVPPRERGSRTDEAIDVCRRLWSEDGVTHHGRHFDIDDVTMLPRPQGSLPIWIAGRSDAAIKRAGRRGDGYMPYLFHPDRYARSLGAVREEAEASSRDPDHITPAIYQFVCLADTFEEARKLAEADLARRYNQSFAGIAERYCVLGNLDQCRERIGEFASAGVRHFILVPLATPDPLQQYRLLARELLPALRPA
jgi:probable F420-dependent oxidoreductase